MKPGDIPEIEPGASAFERLAIGAANVMSAVGNYMKNSVIVCFTCGDSDAERKARGLQPLD